MKKLQQALNSRGLATESWTYLLLGSILLLSLTGCAAPMAQEAGMMAGAVMTSPGYNVVISPSQADFQRKTTVTISGSGFKPKQQLGLRLVMGGVLSDISSAVKPPPVANPYGAFSSVWLLDGEIGAKLLEPTTYTLSVVDEEGRTLATAPLAFRPAEKKPAVKK